MMRGPAMEIPEAYGPPAEVTATIRSPEVPESAAIAEAAAVLPELKRHNRSEATGHQLQGLILLPKTRPELSQCASQ